MEYIKGPDGCRLILLIGNAKSNHRQWPFWCYCLSSHPYKDCGYNTVTGFESLPNVLEDKE
jgi:hypothetical protein